LIDENQNKRTMNDIFDNLTPALKVIYVAIFLLFAAYFADYIFGKFFSA
jgi:hypothetical protein